MPWKRIILEGLVIVGSILLAFAIDAWWQESVDRTSTHEMLMALEADMRANAGQLSSTAQAHRAVVAAGQEMLALTGPGADSERVAASASPMSALMGPVRTRLQSGVLSALIASGELARIESVELRTALSAWPQTVANLERIEDMAIDGWRDEARTRILQYLPQLELEVASGFGGLPDLRAEFLRAAPAESRFESDYRGLLGDMQFESAVVQRVTLAMISADVIETRMLPQTDSILELIRIELGSN